VREERIENEISEDVAESYVPSLAIVTRNVHVPALTKATTPVDEPIVHTGAVVLEYVLVPEPTEAVLVRVGGVSLTPYEE
jgi:hypothetical protein